MPTAKSSNRFDGGLRNHTLEKWTAGVPDNFDVITSAGTVVQLTKEMHDFFMAGQPPHPEIHRLARDPFDVLVLDSFSAARFYATGVWAARSNSIQIEGVNNLLVGDAQWGLPWVPGNTGTFTFWARGTKGKLIEVLFAMRDAAGNNPVYLNREPATWSTTVTGISVKLLPHWQQYSIPVKFPLLVGGTGFAGASRTTDSLVFGVFNVSAANPGAADPFVFDLDGFRWRLAGEANVHEEA
jgi:hypothetical protein